MYCYKKGGTFRVTPFFIAKNNHFIFILHLKSIAPPKDGIFEWTATVLNINPGYNEKLLSACKPLKEYAILIEIIKEYRQKYDEEEVSKIQKIYDIAKEFAPDYNVEKIMAKLG